MNDEFYASLCDIFEETLVCPIRMKKPPLNDEQKEIIKKMKEINDTYLKGVEHPDPLREQERETGRTKRAK